MISDDGWYRALKMGIKAYPYGISARDSHSEILGQTGQWGSMFCTFNNWTAQDGTRQIVNSGPIEHCPRHEVHETRELSYLRQGSLSQW